MTYSSVSDKLHAVVRLCFSDGPESNVSKRWLLTSSTKLDTEFISRRQYSTKEAGEYIQIQVGSEVFLWPSGAPLTQGLAILSELFNRNHGHQYLYGPTQLTSDDVVLDIGASEGSFSAFVTSRCRRVIAVEPTGELCRLMEKLFEIRKQPPPMIFRCFLGDRPSTAYLLEDPANPGRNRMSFELIEGSEAIPVRTLDELVSTLEEKPTFVKCDAEGAALQILAGGREYLSEYRPKLAIASYHTPTEFRDLCEFLKPLGYRVKGKGFLYSERCLRVQMLHAW